MTTASLHRFANPAQFARASRRVMLPLAVLCVGLLLWGLYLALHASPPDYQQGETVRIMYVHVPSAWLSLMAYSVMAAGSVSYLVWRHPLGDLMAREAAPLGAVFALITLITGSLWGKPMWGAWWVWDARLTSMLMLFFMYIGYIALAQTEVITDANRKICAILALLGFVNIPIIKFSVEWWNTLHQPASILRRGGSSIDPSMEAPLFVMFGAFFCLFLLCLLMRVQARMYEQKWRRIQLQSLHASVK